MLDDDEADVLREYEALGSYGPVCNVTRVLMQPGNDGHELPDEPDRFDEIETGSLAFDLIENVGQANAGDPL